MELSKLQLNILNNNCDKTVVISSAASGKTRILTEKVRQLLRAGVNPRNIATITFTNMAAAELRQRLGEDYKDGLFVGTIHALANYMLCRNGINTDSIINNEEFDKLFELIKKNPNSVYHYEWILLDEAQDSDEKQFDFLFNMINPDCFFVVGDPKQSIYSFKGSNPKLMMSLIHKGAKIFDMNENYRNCPQVLSFAKRLIKPTGLIDNSISKTNYSGYVAEIPYDIKKIISILSEEEDLVNWAILTRTNAQISYISDELRSAGIPFDTFKQGDLSKEELLTKMKQNTVKVLTVHSAKGLEWENVIVVGMKYYNNEERNVCYVAATRARRYLAWMGPVRKNKYSF